MFHGKRKGQNTVMNIEEKVWQGGQEVDQTLAGGILVQEKLEFKAGVESSQIKLEETQIIVHLQQDVTSILHKQGLQQREKVHARVKHILRQRKEIMTQVHLNQSIANLIPVPLHQDAKIFLHKQVLQQRENVQTRVKYILRRIKERMTQIHLKQSIANLILVPLHQDVKSCLCKQSLKQIEKVHARVKHILRKRKESMIKIYLSQIIANLLHKQDQ